MEVNEFNVIKGVVVTEKSGKLYKKEGKITLHVDVKANKIEIRKAIEKIWDVKVDSVNVVKVHGKTKRFSRRLFTTSNKKKAIVALKKGHSIDLPGQFEGSEVREGGN